MPKLYKLASERFSGQGVGGGGIAPVSLSTPQLTAPSASMGIRAPQLSVDAGRVQFTPLPVPEIQTGDEWNAAAKFFGVLAAETFKFQERQDQVDADLLVTQYENSQREKWVGKYDQDGNWVKGQSQHLGRAFNKTHPEYVGSIDADFNDTLMSASPSVRQKAALRMYGVRNTYLDRAAQKNVVELERAENDARFAELMGVQKEFEIDPDRAWEQTKVVAGTARTEEDKYEIMSKMGVFAVKKIYDAALVSGADEETALSAATEWFTKRRDDFPEGAELEAGSILRVHAKAVAAEKEAKQKEAREALQSRYKYTGASEVYLAIAGGPATLPKLHQLNKQLEAVYADKPHLILEVQEKMYKDAFQGLMQSHGYMYAKAAFAELEGAITEQEGFYPGAPQVISSTKAFVYGELKTQSDNLSFDSRVAAKRRLFQEITSAKNPEELAKISARLTQMDMKAEELMTFDGFINNHTKEMQGDIDDATKQVQDANFLEFRLEADQGYSTQFEDAVMNAFRSGNVRREQVEEVLDLAKKSTFESRPDYKEFKSEVGKMIDLDQMYYDPETRKVGFWNMLEEEEKTKIKLTIERAGKSPEMNQRLAVASLVTEAERWMKRGGNEGKTYQDFMVEFFSQQPEVKRGRLSNVLRKLHNSPLGPGGGPFPILRVEDGPLMKEVGYESFGVEPPPAPETSPRVKVIDASGTTLEESIGKLSGLSLEDIKKSKLGEYAVNNIPAYAKSNYQGKSTDWLLALQRVREQRPHIDYFSAAEIDMIVQAVMHTSDFETWKEQIVGKQ